MTFVLPVPVPASFVQRSDLDRTANVLHQIHGLRFRADGSPLLVTELYANLLASTGGRGRTQVMVATELDPGWTITAQHELPGLAEQLQRRMGRRETLIDTVFSLSAADEPVLCTSEDRTVVLGSDYSVVAIHAADDDRPGVTSVSAAGGGALYTRRTTELFWGEGTAPLADGLPELRPLARVYPSDENRYDEDAIAHSIAGQAGYPNRYRRFHGIPTVLRPDRIMVPLFRRYARGGSQDHSAFRYAVLDEWGRVLTTLPLTEADSPYRPASTGHLACLPHPVLDGWVTRSEAALHLFSADGELLRRVPLAEDPAMKELRPMFLLAVSPVGELVFHHLGHRTLLVTRPVDEAGRLPAVLAEASQAYRPAWNRLKKVLPFDQHFLGWEERTERSLPRTPRKRSTPGRASKPAAAAEAEPATADGATSFPPLSFADSLVALEADGPLAEYLDACRRLVDLDADPATEPEDRNRVAATVGQLEADHLAAWVERWNLPWSVFSGADVGPRGLPESCLLDGVPRQGIDGLEGQLGRFPIRRVRMSHVGTTGIKTLAALPPVAQAPELEIAGSSKVRLGPSLVRWLAKAGPDRLTTLDLFRVDTTGADGLALLDALPALRHLRLGRSLKVTDALADLARSEQAARLESLSLDTTALAPMVGELLGAFTALRRLDLRDCGLDDTIADRRIAPLPITELDVRKNRLGADGLAALLAAHPGITSLACDAVDGVASVLDEVAPALTELRLETLRDADTSGVTDRIAAARQLRSLEIQGYYPFDGLFDVLLELPHLEEARGWGIRATHEDLVRLAESSWQPTELHLGGPVDTAGLLSLAEAGTPLRRLRRLSLWGGTLLGITALLDAAPVLDELVLYHTDISDASMLCLNGPSPRRLRLFVRDLPTAARRRLSGHYGPRLIVD